MKTVGILGGMGPQATMDLEARIHRVSQRLIPQEVNRGYPPLIVYYVRRAPMVLNPDHTMREPLKPDPELLRGAQYLGTAADLLLIGSNTAHLFAQDIETAARKPVVSLIEAALAEVRRRKIKRVGVIAVTEALAKELYLRDLQRIGCIPMMLPTQLQSALDEEIWALMEGKEKPSGPEVATRAVGILREMDAAGIILGCTELPLLLGHRADSDPDLINPSQLAAENAVQAAIA